MKYRHRCGTLAPRVKPSEETIHAQSTHREPRRGRGRGARRRRDRHGRADDRRRTRGDPRLRQGLAQPASRTASSRSAPTTRPSRRGSAAPRRRSRGRSPTRTAARATSRPSPTRSRSSSASRRRRSSGPSCRSTTRTARARSRSTSTSRRSRTRPSGRRRSTSRRRTTSSTSRSSAARASRSRRRKSIAGLKKYKLGAQIGTTSYTTSSKYIKPSSSPLVYDTNDAAVQALKNGQIDGIVVDLPTAFYVTAVQVDDGKVVGQLPTKGTQGALRLVLQKGNPLDACVEQGARPPLGDGTIKKLQTTYLAARRRARPEVAGPERQPQLADPRRRDRPRLEGGADGRDRPRSRRSSSSA